MIHIIGYILLSLPFIACIIFSYIEQGLKATIAMIIFIVVLISIILLGAYFSTI